MTRGVFPHRWALIAAFLLAPLLGWAKVERQRLHPPSWALQEIHQYDGYVSIDGFAHRAGQFRDLIAGETTQGTPLLESLRTELHPTSITVPAIVGALAVLTGSIPSAFLVCNLVLYVLTVWLVVLAARRHLEELGNPAARELSAWAALVFSAHVDTCRVAMQLHVDFAVTCLGMAALVAMAHAHGKSAPPRSFLGITGLHVLGAFTKASYAPFLLVAPLVAVWSRSRARLWWLSALSIAIPAAAVLGYDAAIGAAEPIHRDAGHFLRSLRAGERSTLQFLLEFALAVQWLPLLAWKAAPRRSMLATIALSVAVVYVASLFAFGMPAIPRLYLPMIALLSAVSCPALAILAERRGRWPIYAWAVVNLALSGYGVTSSP